MALGVNLKAFKSMEGLRILVHGIDYYPLGVTIQKCDELSSAGDRRCLEGSNNV